MNDGIEKRLPEIYLAAALAVSVALCLLTPPFYLPDEIAHASRELQIAHGGLLGQRTPEGVGGFIDSGAKAVMDAIGDIQLDLERRHPPVLKRPNGRVTAAQLAPLSAARWSHQLAFMRFQNTAVYPPLLYIPQALGWRIGEASGLTVVHSLFLARLLAALSAVAIGWFALRVCASCRWLLTAYLLFPTVLALGASCSQDALLLPTAAMAAAVLTRPISARRLFTIGELVALTALLAVCITSRPPYFPLAVALALPALNLPRSRRGDLLRICSAIAIVILLLGAWVLLVRPLGTFVHPLAHPDQQIAFLRAHPLEAAGKISSSTLIQTPILAAQAIEVHGLLDIYAPLLVYALLFAGMGGVVLVAPAQGLATWSSRAALAAALAAVFAGISLVEYIVFTAPQSDWVACLEGRYYLPPLILALLFVRHVNLQQSAREPSRSSFSSTRTRRRILLASGAAFLAAVLCTPWVAARGYYNLSPLAALRIAGP